MRKMIHILIYLLFLPLAATDFPKEVVFVSLGSHCEVSMKLANHQLRYFSTPVDWMLTQDHEGFARLIDDRFLHMLDEQYLIMNMQQEYVVNTYYNIDFRHDWPDTDFHKHLPDIKEKYERRIKRFYNLSELAKRVVFIRSAFDRNLNVANNMPFDTPESGIIASEQATHLKEVLDRQFPSTDFLLVVINYDESHCKAPGVMEFIIHKDHKLEDYKILVDLLNDPEKYDSLKKEYE